MHRLTPVAVVAVLLPVAFAEGLEQRREIHDRSGAVIEILGPAGRPRDLAGGRRAGATRPAPQRALGARAEAAPPCAVATEGGMVARESQGEGFRVDACGRLRNEAGDLLRPERRRPEGAPQLTIHRMT